VSPPDRVREVAARLLPDLLSKGGHYDVDLGGRTVPVPHAVVTRTAICWPPRHPTVATAGDDSLKRR
jgi:hypothetical protein